MNEHSDFKSEIHTRLSEDIHKLTYSQQQIIECAIRKAESQEFQDCYGKIIMIVMANMYLKHIEELNL